MKKFLKFLLVIVLAGVAFYLYSSGAFKGDAPLNGIKDDFDSMNRESWYVGEWRTNKPAYEKAIIDDGIIKLQVQETDRGPYMLSEIYAVKKPSIITLKRRIMVNYGNDRFTGGMALLQTDGNEFKPKIVEEGADMGFGNALVLIEYVHNLDPLSRRPGQDGFRILMPDWQTDGNYKIIPAVFGEWFDETLIYNSKTGQTIYRINEKEYNLRNFAMGKKNIRVFMHSYGNGIGHSLKMDWFEMKIEPIS